ncbi:integrase [Sphingomonas kaistensis]|uniref:Integrase n=1 Tax=Sphingomonas kaistensis TaxID=298708 RepID=A0A7X5Y920_9SPHN|nr:site-specific integrase [Sphingomonas kaistensis]NJC05741.1 integrase [Sphingomonas kaistensis]
MGRAVRDHRLESRSARLKLPSRNEPHWRLISEGFHIGYFKGKRLGKWVCRYRAPGSSGSYVKSTLGEADDISDANGSTILSFAQAQEAAREWLAYQDTDEAKAGPLTVGQILDDYLKGFTGKGIVDTRSRVEAIIRPHFGELDVRDLTTKLIRDWHEARARTPAKLRTGKNAKQANTRPANDAEAIRKRRSTANRDLTVLKAALNRAADDNEWMRRDVWGNVKPFPSVDVARRRFLSGEEFTRIVTATDEEFRPMVAASLLTGGRYSELRHTKVRDYDRESATLWLAETKDAANPRAAYLDAEGVALLEEMIAGKDFDDLIFQRPDGGQWMPSQQGRFVARAYKAAKLQKLTYHDLRRSYGARLARQGVPLGIIAEALGHKDERITRKHYAHLVPSHVSETVRKAISGLGVIASS